MSELYNLYLHLYSLAGVGDHEAFSATLTDALTHAEGDVTGQIQINAVAAIAVTNENTDDQEAVYFSLLNYFEFQQVWQRYRAASVKQ
jgi:hypothetical protein